MTATSTLTSSGSATSENGEIVDFSNAETRSLGVIVEIITEDDHQMVRLISPSWERDRDEETSANILDLRPATDVEPEEMIRLLVIKAQLIGSNTAFIHAGHLICPLCGAKDRILEYAEAFKAHMLTVDDDNTLSASDEDATFNTDRFECECGREVEIPDAIEIIHC
ncbi:hypothetical protein [Streptosporangium sp. NPDC001681]|uniref:hypothetical protein n=1 Tax=Streptosporangium sp. NPDC001681 TaxID=3154395 RepID=UPI003329F7C3